MSDDLFRNIMGKEMGDFEPKKDQTVQKTGCIKSRAKNTRKTVNI